MSRDDLPLFEGGKYDFPGKYYRVLCNWTASHRVEVEGFRVWGLGFGV